MLISSPQVQALRASTSGGRRDRSVCARAYLDYSQRGSGKRREYSDGERNVETNSFGAGRSAGGSVVVGCEEAELIRRRRTHSELQRRLWQVVSCRGKTPAAPSCRPRARARTSGNGNSSAQTDCRLCLSVRSVRVQPLRVRALREDRSLPSNFAAISHRPDLPSVNTIIQSQSAVPRRSPPIRQSAASTGMMVATIAQQFVLTRKKKGLPAHHIPRRGGPGTRIVFQKDRRGLKTGEAAACLFLQLLSARIQ